ncbi:SDR family NAD(P)-dependent oxidoreductase [Streptomyces sp. NPDC014861]|uniref:SDR family NAD(P)-dependent oxidoreductase n=1 Tax=Streptomyces sp. NPDC014861 TaxID=3364923 RepID=UPI003702B5B2
MSVRCSSAARYPGDCVSGGSYGSDRTPLGPRIVNIDSVNICPGWLNLVTYSTAKAGLLGLPRSLARELDPYGIIPVRAGSTPADGRDNVDHPLKPAAVRRRHIRDTPRYRGPGPFGNDRNSSVPGRA